MFRITCLGVMLGAFALGAAAQDTLYQPRGQQFPAPNCMDMRNAWEGPQTTCPPFAHERWLADLNHWRTERRIRITYDPSRYDLPALKWTQSSFIQPQMMVHDRYFYDPVAGQYTVDRYLDDLEKRYGGIDSVLIWSTYPNMGIDDRNQLEMVESYAGRRGRRSTDGRRLSSPRRSRSLSHDDVGRRHAPAEAAVAAGYRPVDETDRC